MASPLRIVATIALVLVIVASTSVAAISTGVLSAEVSGDGVAKQTLAPEFDRQVIAGDSPTQPDDLGQWVWADPTPELTVEVGAPTFEDESEEYRQYTVRVTEQRTEGIGPGTEILGETTVTVRELDRTSLQIELEEDSLTRSTDTDVIRLENPDKRISVKRATVFVGIYPKDGSKLWKGDTVEAQIIRKTGDIDGDGLRNSREIGRETHFLHADADGDDLLDGPEITRFDSDPTVEDTDGDDVIDSHEVRNGTDPRRADTDGDGLSDRREITVLPTDPTVADTDGDGLSDFEELQRGTDPTVPDSDGDGLADGREVRLGTDPMAIDTDGDGLRDDWEVQRYDTNPTNPDTDGDGENDGAERGVPPADLTAVESDNSHGGADNTSGGQADSTMDKLSNPIEAVAPLVESGMYAPFAMLAGALALRRLVNWVTYP